MIRRQGSGLPGGELELAVAEGDQDRLGRAQAQVEGVAGHRKGIAPAVVRVVQLRLPAVFFGQRPGLR